MKIPIIFENDEVVVINKPAGVVAHADAHHNLEESVAGQFGLAVGQEGRPGIVHRLDKPTSGAMVLAKTQGAYEDLIAQFKAREVEKEYLALVWGDVTKNPKFEIRNPKVSGFDIRASNFAFIIDAPVARHPGNSTKFAVVEGGKKALTRFVVGSRFEVQGDQKVTLLRAYPETGRTHQIRVHLKAFGHPVVGDERYQTQKQQLAISAWQLAEQANGQEPKANRLHLHATRLGFKLPPKGDFVAFDAPLPNELEWMYVT